MFSRPCPTLMAGPSPREAKGLGVKEEPGLTPSPKPFLGPLAGLSQKLVDIFRQSPLGRFLAELSVGQQREILQRYLKDFLLLTLKVSTGKELEVSSGGAT